MNTLNAPVGRPIRGRCRRAGLSRLGRSAAICIATAVALTATADHARAQSATAYVQAALLDNAAATFTLGIHFTETLGTETVLPAPGGSATSSGSTYLTTFMVAAGASIARERGDDNGFTVAAHGGVMRRTAWFVEEVGVVGYANLNPLGAGPALRGKIATAIDVTAGGLWMTDEAEGFRWFVSGGLSLALLGDLFSR
jgi:hypothetical protein